MVHWFFNFNGRQIGCAVRKRTLRIPAYSLALSHREGCIGKGETIVLFCAKCEGEESGQYKYSSPEHLCSHLIFPNVNFVSPSVPRIALFILPASTITILISSDHLNIFFDRLLFSVLAVAYTNSTKMVLLSSTTTHNSNIIVPGMCMHFAFSLLSVKA